MKKSKSQLSTLILTAIFLIMGTASIAAADRITATIVATNAPTTNGMTFAITTTALTTRTWTNSVNNSAAQILTNSTAAGSATNLALHLAATPPSGAVPLLTGASNITIYANTGVPLIVTATPAGYFSITYATQAVTSAYTVRVPETVEAAAMRTNIASGLVDWLNGNEATNQVSQTNPAFAQFLGTTNEQTIAAIKYFTNISGIWYGYVSNATGISGNVNYMTNGLYRSPVLNDATLTNGTFYGTQNYGDVLVEYTSSGPTFYSAAAGEYILTLTNGSVGLGSSLFQIGQSPALTKVITSDAIGNLSLEYVQALTNAAIASSVFAATNNFPAGSDIAFGRYAVTSLANGNNAAVPVGTNVFIEVSGPSADFTINGISGSPNRDGKLLIIVNQTGFNMTIAHQSGTDPTAGNRIITMTGADRATTGNGTATLIYSGSASRYILVSFDP